MRVCPVRRSLDPRSAEAGHLPFSHQLGVLPDIFGGRSMTELSLKQSTLRFNGCWSATWSVW